MEPLEPPAAAIRFAADAMLGRLARWLRVLAFDTFYEDGIADPQLVSLSNDEGRVLLTRDRHLLRELRPPRAYEVRQDAPLAQLHAVVTDLRLPAPPELFLRCMVCNSVLGPALPQHEADAMVPHGVRGIPGPVRQCPTCLRVYWHGSHARRMRAAIERTLPGWLGDAR
jgi:uncharacterized protein with PIN domain